MRRSASFIAAAVVLQTAIYLTGCELAPNDPGSIRANERPTVFFLNTFENVLDTIPDSFDSGFGVFYDTTVTIHANVVNYSSIISWYGTDKDGFIDHFEYAIEAIEDSVYRYGEGTPLSGDESYEDIRPTNIDDEDWVSTTATSDTVLFPAPTLQDRHRLWIRSVDDRGARSDMKFADFVAVTAPPSVTLHCTADDIEEGMCPGDSVFSLFGHTPSWNGLTFNWEGEDPDGTIETYVVRVDDGPAWLTTDTWITLSGLHSGQRTIYVYAIDNAGAISPVPAQRTLHVAVPTFEEDVLVVDDSDMDWEYQSFGDWPLSNDEFRAFYNSALEQAGIGSWTWTTPDELTRAEAGHYSNILWLSEQVSAFYKKDLGAPAEKLAEKLALVEEYLDAGGNLVLIGSLASAMGDPGQVSTLLEDRLHVSGVGGTNTLSLSSLGVAGFNSAPAYLYNGEPFTGVLYNPGAAFEDIGIDGYAGSLAGNGIWDGGWSEFYEFYFGANPPLGNPGFSGGSFEDLGSAALSLYENQNGATVGVAIEQSTYRAVLLAFPLHFVLPAYHSADLGSDPYGGDPWALLSDDAAESAAAVLRQAFTYTGVIE